MRTSTSISPALVTALVTALALGGATGLGGLATQQAKLTASDAEVNDTLGIGGAADGDTALLGASGRNSATGAVYVFTRTGTSWTEQATLTAADGAPGDMLGMSVALSGDTAIAGASTKDAYRGAAYIFERTGQLWTQVARLASADAADDDRFGGSVAVEGGTAVVGASNKDLGQGAAYVFTRNGATWTQQAKLVAADAESGDQFGHSVAVSGDTVVVGASAENAQRGAAYTFRRSGATWTQEAKLTAADTFSNDSFGFSVACKGDRAAVGTPYQNRGHGAVYVFARSSTTWSQEAKLTQTDPADNDIFGISVSCSASRVVSGAYVKNASRGAAYVFERSGTAWAQSAKLTPADAAANDHFGWAAALSGDTVLVGAFWKDTQRGAAYVFTLPRPAGCCLPVSVTAKANAKHPERSTLVVSGTLDTGGGEPDFSGAATFDAGGFRLDVPEFVAKGKSLVYGAGGISLTVTPAKSGSSRATFSLKATGDLAGRVDREGPLALRFKNASHDLAGSANLVKGRLAPHGVAEPELAVLAAAATLRGGGKDSFKLTMCFATDGVVPALVERDLTIGFGDAYTSALLPGSSFVRRRSTYVFTAKAPGITKVTIDYAKGTISVAGTGVDLGAFAEGGNEVVVTLKRGSETQSATVRMSRGGTKLTY